MSRVRRMERKNLPEALAGSGQEVGEGKGRGPQVPYAEGGRKARGVKKHPAGAPVHQVILLPRAASGIYCA